MCTPVTPANTTPEYATPGSTAGTAPDHSLEAHITEDSWAADTRMDALSLLFVRPPKQVLVGLGGCVGHLETTIFVILE